MTIQWPAALPYQPSMETYAVKALGGANVKSPMNSGRVRMRPQFTVRIAPVAWGRIYTAAEMALWRDFVVNTLQQASARFQMPFWDLATRTYPTKTVQIVDGLEGIQESPVSGYLTQVQCVMNVEGL